VVGLVFLFKDAATNRRNQVSTEVPANVEKNNGRLLAVKDIVRVLDALRISWRALQQPASNRHKNYLTVYVLRKMSIFIARYQKVKRIRGR
jgi:hypothetical protein